MAFGTKKNRARAYQKISHSILNDIISGKGEKDCKRGKVEIARRYSKAQFEKGLSLSLKSMQQPEQVPVTKIKDLIVTLSPLVRQWDAESGKVISDNQNLELPLHCSSLIKKALGQSEPWLQEKLKRDSTLHVLFELGVLSLAPPNGFGDEVKITKK